MKIVSACLLGLNCKYSGESNTNQDIINLLESEVLIPVCPEQLGGLNTPRPPCEIVGDRVLSEEGCDFTKNFVRGSEEVLKLANLYNIKEAILKESSPSCGSNFIYDGSFTSKKIRGQGLCTKLLIKNGIKVVSDEDICK